MKVTTPGTLVVEGFDVYMHGWVFEGDGRRFANAQDLRRECLRAALLFILSNLRGGGDAEPETPIVSFDVERAALDVIAAARWKPNGEVDD